MSRAPLFDFGAFWPSEWWLAMEADFINQDPAGGSHVSEEWCSEMRTRPPSLW